MLPNLLAYVPDLYTTLTNQTTASPFIKDIALKFNKSEHIKKDK